MSGNHKKAVPAKTLEPMSLALVKGHAFFKSTSDLKKAIGVNPVVPELDLEQITPQK